MNKNRLFLTRSTHFFVRLILLAVLLISAGCAQPQATLTSIHVTVDIDGKQYALTLPAGSSVQGALQRAGTSLNNLDRIEPASYTILAENDVVHITRVREVFSIKENTIPFERLTAHNESLPVGQTLMVQNGVNGKEQVTYRQVLENEQEVSSDVFKREAMVEPVPEISMVGVQKPFTPVPIPGKLVYLAGGSAWLMEGSTGNRRPIITSGDLDGRVLSISPKGDWLLFTRLEKSAPTSASGNESNPQGKINSLWAIDLSSEGAKPVNLKIDNVIHFAAWVPDKSLTILYSTVEPRSTPPGWQANNDLRMLNFAPTGTVIKQEKILDSSAGGMYGWWGTTYAISPDGALLAYARPDSVGLVDLQNKQMVPLVNLLPFQTQSDWAWVPGIGWSPDHQVLFLVTHAPTAGLESADTSPLFDLSALPLGALANATTPSSGTASASSGSPASQASSAGTPSAEAALAANSLITLIKQVGMFAYPVPAPSNSGQGYRVAYLQAIIQNQSDSKRYRLAVIDRDGSNGKEIFPPEDHQGVEPQRVDPQRVAWSPDSLTNGSLWLAVNYQGDLYLVDSVTGDSQRVTGDGLISRFDWK